MAIFHLLYSRETFPASNYDRSFIYHCDFCITMCHQGIFSKVIACNDEFSVLRMTLSDTLELTGSLFPENSKIIAQLIMVSSTGRL